MSDTTGMPQTVAVPWEVHRAQMAQRAAEEAAGSRMDETEPGGRYLLPDGTEVDANGKPRAKDGVNTAPAGSSAMLGSPLEVAFPDTQAQARADVAERDAAAARLERDQLRADMEAMKAAVEASQQAAKATEQAAKAAEGEAKKAERGRQP